MHATKCPPRDQLKEYLGGRLDDEDSDVVQLHLENCSRCEQTATEIDTEPDSLVELLQSSPSPAPQQLR